MAAALQIAEDLKDLKDRQGSWVGLSWVHGHSVWQPRGDPRWRYPVDMTASTRCIGLQTR